MILLISVVATSIPPTCNLTESYVHTERAARALKDSLPKGITVKDLELPATAEPGAARRIFEEYGVVIVRGLQFHYADAIARAAQAAFQQSLALFDKGRLQPVVNGNFTLGWVTPDQTLYVPAPAGHVRDKQVMVLGLDIYSDATMLATALDGRTLDIVQQLLGSSNIELFGKGQVCALHARPGCIERVWRAQTALSLSPSRALPRVSVLL